MNNTTDNKELTKDDERKLYEEAVAEIIKKYEEQKKQEE